MNLGQESELWAPSHLPQHSGGGGQVPHMPKGTGLLASLHLTQQGGTPPPIVALPKVPGPDEMRFRIARASSLLFCHSQSSSQSITELSRQHPRLRPQSKKCLYLKATFDQWAFEHLNRVEVLQSLSHSAYETCSATVNTDKPELINRCKRCSLKRDLRGTKLREYSL